jgi:hypothetical protein
MKPGWIELVVRGIQMPTDEGGLASIVIGPCNHPTTALLTMQVGTGDAHALGHELRGETTTRSQAVCLVSRVAEALGGTVVAAHLVLIRPGVVTGSLEVETPSGTVSIPAEPGQVLSAAICLDIPLIAERDLFAPPRPETPITGQLATFLAGLDLSDLEPGEP